MKKSLIILLFVSCSFLTAQETQIIHHMNWVPQSLKSNPAQLPDYNFYIGLPGISSIFLGVDHGISFNDVFQRIPGDTLLLDPAYVLSNLKEDNYIGISVDADILNIGFRLRKSYISFSISEKNRFRFSMPKSLLSFLWQGNGAFLGETVDLSSMAIEALSYGEAAIGLAMPVGEKWIAAGRFKYLSGLGHVHLQARSLELYTDPQSYAVRFKSGLDFYSAGPDISIDEDISFGIDADRFKFQNRGMAIDLGGSYMPTDKWTLSFGLNDLGYIKWDAAARRHYINDGEYTFSGLEIADVFSTDSIDFDKQMDKIVDTLKSIFNVQSEDGAYTRQLRPMYYVSGSYKLASNSLVGALLRADYFADRLHPTLNLAYHHRFGRILSLSGSYAIRNRSYFDIGAGMSLKLGPVQFYLMGDNLLSVLWPENIRSYSVHFGLNFVFGKPATPRDKLIQKMEEEPPTGL